VEIERPVARVFGMNIDLPRLPQGVRLDEVALVVNVEPVFDRVVFEVGDRSGEVDSHGRRLPL